MQLFGADVIGCYTQPSDSNHSVDWNICDVEFLNHRDSLLRSYPNSLFLSVIRNVAIAPRGDDAYASLFVQTIDDLYGDTVLVQGYHDLRGIKPLFSDMFKWSTEIDFEIGGGETYIFALFGYKHLDWSFEGPSNKTLTADVNSPGPFVTPDKFAMPGVNEGF